MRSMRKKMLDRFMAAKDKVLFSEFEKLTEPQLMELALMVDEKLVWAEYDEEGCTWWVLRPSVVDAIESGCSLEKPKEESNG